MSPIKTSIKICCISSPDEARMALEAGADAIGLVGKMPSGPGPIPDELIAEISATLPPGFPRFLLTSEQTANAIIEHHQRVNTGTIQIVDELIEGNYEMIREKIPGIRLVQVIHVMGEDSIDQAKNAEPFVHAILLDSGNPTARVKTLGGTGNIHDWTISREIVRKVAIPVYLAGGLNAENVEEAIRTVRPYGVDVCSGVRTNGKLDPEKLKKFIDTVRSMTVSNEDK